jgi:RNA polymerase sigma factor (TIGR02999 family)
MAQRIGEITVLLERMRGGSREASARLLPLVYTELVAIARAYVRPDTSLEPRGLVHELYLRIANARVAASDRKHFYSIAALAMRQILADRARKKRASKRAGDQVQVTLSGLAETDRDLDALAVEDALSKLEALSPRQARVVEMRCLLGMSVPDVAAALEISERTVATDWRLARAWLTRELRGK